jgi:dsRNA-specific ribonuclease
MGSRTKAATVEAVIGAAYLDGGLEAATTAMKNLGVI